MDPLGTRDRSSVFKAPDNGSSFEIDGNPIAFELGLDVDVESPLELNHSSYVLAGLFDLEHARVVRRVRIVPALDQHRGEIHVRPDGRMDRSAFRAHKTTFLTVQNGRRRVRLAVDFRDASFIFPEDGLRKVDILFKRSFDDAVAHAVSAHFSTQIVPAGLSFSVRSPYERGRRGMIANFAVLSMLSAVKLDRSAFQRWRQTWRSTRRHILHASEQHPFTTDLRPAYSDRSLPSVFFQTRTFNRNDDTDANEIHADRAALIRALRAEFGPQFVGGFVPGPLSTKHFPDCLSAIPADKFAYLDAMSKATIVVYTRGLLNSPAWKLPEYLAFGKCIVAEQVRGRLPSPLTDGETISEFRSVDECIARCHELLANQPKRALMEEAARLYYERWVDPAAGIHRILRAAWELNSARS